MEKNELKDKIGNEIIENSQKNENYILKLINDKYGNYVIQTAIKNCSDHIKQKLIEKINNISYEKRGKFSYYVYNLIEKNNQNIRK